MFKTSILYKISDRHDTLAVDAVWSAPRSRVAEATHSTYSRKIALTWIMATPKRIMMSSGRTRNKSRAHKARGSGVFRVYPVQNHSAQRKDIGIACVSRLMGVVRVVGVDGAKREGNTTESDRG